MSEKKEHQNLDCPTPDEAFGDLLDVEDPQLEDILSCLAPPDDLADRISDSIVRRAKSPSFIARISTFAAILLIGLIIGMLISGIDFFSEKEAEAASLQNHLSGYTRNSQLVAEQTKLLSQAAPGLVSDTLASELKLASLHSSATMILNILKRVPDSSDINSSNREDLSRFFDSAVIRLDRINHLASQEELCDEDINLLVQETSRIVLPERLRMASSDFLPDVGQLEISNPDLEEYLQAKRFVFSGDFDRAAEHFGESNGHAASDSIRDLSLYWMARCYGEMGKPDEAALRYQMLPKSFRQQVRFNANHRGQISITVTTGSIAPGSYQTLHMLKLPSGNTAVVTILKNGSVDFRIDPFERVFYQEFEEFKKDKPDIYHQIFDR